MLKSVTVKIDDELLKKIDRYAESTYQTRTRAIIQMLESDRKSTRLNSSHTRPSRMPSSA